MAIQRAQLYLHLGLDNDNLKKYQTAVICYQEALKILSKLYEDKTYTNELYTLFLKKKIQEYSKRVRDINSIKHDRENTMIIHSKKKICAIKITDNSKNYTYQSLFGDYMDNEISEIRIEDPYIALPHQLENLIRFCELAMHTCKNLNIIHLTTTMSTIASQKAEQQSCFTVLHQSLAEYNILFMYEYSSTLHDRHIFLDNGVEITLGRGLDIYKATNKYSVGRYDYNYRKCRESNIKFNIK